ncbi:MAG TPA: NHLP-related RiPP peptide [Dokdonella sp.]
MQNGKLTRDESIALLRKLAGDDAFRAAFERNPATALVDIGLSADEIDALPAPATAPAPLPPKEHFHEALQQVLDRGVSNHICLIVPLLKLTYGDTRD